MAAELGNSVRPTLGEEDMRNLAIVLAVITLLPGLAEAKSMGEPGGGLGGTKHSKLGKDIYVVRRSGNRCALVNGDFGKPPPGAIDGAAYAGKKFAMAALKKSPECKGGLENN
jgi:hypothetical protein